MKPEQTNLSIRAWFQTWSAPWLCSRSLRIWEGDAPEPLATIRLPPGTVYLANAAAFEHQVVHCLDQDPLLEVQGLGASVAARRLIHSVKKHGNLVKNPEVPETFAQESFAPQKKRSIFGFPGRIYCSDCIAKFCRQASETKPWILVLLSCRPVIAGGFTAAFRSFQTEQVLQHENRAEPGLASGCCR